MKKISALFLILFFLYLGVVKAQSEYKIDIKKTNEKIILDGQLNENSWIIADTTSNFHQSFPFDTGYAKSKTVCRLTYDDKNLYISAVCYDEIEGDNIIQSLKRDYSFPISDAFAVVIDPFKDKTNGFNFGVNPLNVQREGLIANGGKFGTSTDWDNKWFSETKIENGKWVVEMAIPFKSLRFKENEKIWLINFVRNDLKRNELSSWVPIPKQYNPNTLAFTAELEWDEAPKKTGSNVAIIPYAITSGYNIYDYKTNSDGSTRDTFYTKLNAGLDAKVAITSSLNLDITINPDFSQVEVDRQQTNLTRFSLFFPERRNFFIENSDLFAQFGFSQIRPFFSRNIGLKNGSSVPILGGLRLSGKLNNNWRIGAMTIQTDKVASLKVDAQNYSVITLQRKVFARSNVSAIFINRQKLDTAEGFFNTDYNRIAGLQYNLSSSNSNWTGIFFFLQSFNPNQPNKSSSHASYINYQTDKWDINWNHEYVGENFIADIGFIPRLFNYNAETGETFRKTYWRLEPSIKYLMYPKSSKSIFNYEIGTYTSNYYDEDYKSIQQYYNASAKLNFQSNAFISIYQEFTSDYLIFDSYIGVDIVSKGLYEFSASGFSFKTDPRKKLIMDGGAKYGGFYNGDRSSGNISLSYRVQPWGIFSLAANADIINNNKFNTRSDIYLIGPKIELSFTRSLFLTAFFQYNTQIENFNINTRLQWRFKPMSDLYIVYTDNYNSVNFNAKNKALVLKLNYWFSL
jgi:hypothetical protein